MLFFERKKQKTFVTAQAGVMVQFREFCSLPLPGLVRPAAWMLGTSPGKVRIVSEHRERIDRHPGQLQTFKSLLLPFFRKEGLALSRSAVAALEFALIVPAMVLLTIGVLDMSKAVILWQQVYNTAHTIPLSASIVAVQTNKTTSLSVTQAQQQMSAIYAEIPWLADGIADGTRSVTLSSITFVPIPGCTVVAGASCFIPNVAWSLAYPGGVGDPHANMWQSATRSCVVPPVQTHPTAPPPVSPLQVPVQLTVLRTLDVTAPDPILVADVHLQYRPFLYGFVTGNFDFWASGYWSVRSISPSQPAYLQYTALTPSGTVGSCPTWP